MSDRAEVPCNGCTLCCRRGQRIALFENRGDILMSYRYHMADIPGFGLLPVLDQQPDGSCIYLTAAGCSIHERSPVICRTFDCRRWYLSMTRAERRRMVRASQESQEVFDAGRSRLASLSSP